MGDTLNKLTFTLSGLIVTTQECSGVVWPRLLAVNEQADMKPESPSQHTEDRVRTIIKPV